MSPHDPAIESLRRVMVRDGAGEGESHGRAAGDRIAPQVDAGQSERLKAPSCLLACFAHYRFEQRLTTLDVAGWLIEHEAAVDSLFDNKKQTIVFRNGRDGDFRCPGHLAEYSGRGYRLCFAQRLRDVREQHLQLRFATRRPCSGALAFQMVSNSCR